MGAARVTDYVRQKFPGFGLNKCHAAARLLYEISRRDRVPPENILPDDITASRDFFQVKFYLLKKRYPSLTPQEMGFIPPLTEMKFPINNRVALTSKEPNPKKIYYESDTAECELLGRLRRTFPKASFEKIDTYSDFVRQHDFTIEDYNRRRETFFIARESFDLFLHCPCSQLSRACGYQIMNAGTGCAFDCVYCYLQGYVNAPGILLPGNFDEILDRFAGYNRPGMRIGTGQFTDSLIFDHLTGFSKKIINAFRRYPKTIFEFKTKSCHIENILTTPAAENILISWSMNPQNVIDSAEFLTASLSERIQAAKQCVEKGYRVGFHFDPVIYYDGWEKDYENVVHSIFDAVDPCAVAWISLGCLRMTLKTRQVMEQRFPDSDLLFAEQINGFDGKLRYPRAVRREIYQKILKWLCCRAPDVMTYLCMEDEQMNRDLNIQRIQTPS